MRDYGRVYSSFWQSPETQGYSEDGRILALYLLTSPHTNLIGCFRLPDAYAAEDLGWSSERVREGLTELHTKGFVSRDEGTKWVLILKYLKWNSFENANVATAAQKAFEQVPSILLKAALVKALLEFGKHLKEDFRNHLETLPKPFANPEPIQSQNQSLVPSEAGTGFEAPPAEDAPARKAKASPPTAETWKAYAEAYMHRYAAEPVRNATVNGQLAQLVSRLGAEESPLVAAWFVRHQNRFYVGAGHSIGVLLKDCEKLRTEWATGRRSTATQAQQADKTQANFNAFAPLLAEAGGTHAEH